MKKNILVCDIDSTIWPAEREYDIAAMELFGQPFFKDGYDWYDVRDLVARYGTDYAAIFRHALAPEKVMKRELYPHVADALREVHEMGYQIMFFTHHHRPRSIAPALRSWLEIRLSIPFTLRANTSRVSKVQSVRGRGGVALVDDKPSTLGAAKAAGLWTATKVQPWNVRLVDSHPEIRGFNSWHEFPQLLAESGPHVE